MLEAVVAQLRLGHDLRTYRDTGRLDCGALLLTRDGVISMASMRGTFSWANIASHHLQPDSLTILDARGGTLVTVDRTELSRVAAVTFLSRNRGLVPWWL